jgi:hypothetical protein
MSGFVYFIAPEDLLHREYGDELRAVKIGYTNSEPRVRMAQLQTGSPVCLSVIAHIHGTPELERAFHAAFSQLGQSGEWFSCLFKLDMLLRKIDREGAPDTLVPRAELVKAMRDTVFAMPDNFPGQDGIGERQMTNPEHLAIFFPEVWK